MNKEQVKQARIKVLLLINGDRTVESRCSGDEGLEYAARVIASGLQNYASHMLKFKPEFESMTFEDLNAFIRQENDAEERTESPREKFARVLHRYETALKRIANHTWEDENGCALKPQEVASEMQSWAVAVLYPYRGKGDCVNQEGGDPIA